MREKEVQKCVGSAAKGLRKNWLHYYNAMRAKIKNITGIKIRYRPITPANPREERKRSHLEEWKADLIAYLQKQGGRMLTTQGRLAKKLGMPLRSLKAILNDLEKDGVIYRDSVRRGPKSFTLLILRRTSTSGSVMVHSGTHYEEQEHVGFSEPAAAESAYTDSA